MLKDPLALPVNDGRTDPLEAIEAKTSTLLETAKGRLERLRDIQGSEMVHVSASLMEQSPLHHASSQLNVEFDQVWTHTEAALQTLAADTDPGAPVQERIRTQLKHLASLMAQYQEAQALYDRFIGICRSVGDTEGETTMRRLWEEYGAYYVEAVEQKSALEGELMAQEAAQRDSPLLDGLRKALESATVE